jgi:hypothetical protein
MKTNVKFQLFLGRSFHQQTNPNFADDSNMTTVKLNLPSTLRVLDFTTIIQTFITYPMYYENNWKATWRKSDPEKGSIALLFHHCHS